MEKWSVNIRPYYFHYSYSFPQWLTILTTEKTFPRQSSTNGSGMGKHSTPASPAMGPLWGLHGVP